MSLFILGVVSLFMAISTSAQYVQEGVEVAPPVDGTVNLRGTENKLKEPEFLLSNIGDNVPTLVSKINVKQPDIMDGIGGVVKGGKTQQKTRKKETEGPKINVEQPDIMDPIGGIAPGSKTEQKTRPKRKGDMIGLEETVDTIEDEVNLECNPACPSLFKPVCGILLDGSQKTFSNECQLKVMNCLLRTEYELLRTGEC